MTDNDRIIELLEQAQQLRDEIERLTRKLDEITGESFIHAREVMRLQALVAQYKEWLHDALNPTT